MSIKGVLRVIKKPTQAIAKKIRPGKTSGTLIGAKLLGSSIGMGSAIIGGTLGLLGGAMGLAGGVLKAGSTIAGIASDASTGVMTAAGGMQGGGQSGNVDSGTELQSIGKTMNKSGLGSGLGNMKSSFGALAGGGGGAMSLLPTGEESETTLLGQILGQIRTNTTLLSSMLGVLSAGAVQSRVDSAKNNRVEPPEGKAGLAKRTFTALGSKLKSLSGSLAGGAGTLLKGVGIGVLFLLFKKYRSQITDMVGKIFETLDGWYTALKDGNNPIDTMFANVKSFFKESVLPTLKDMTISFLQMFYDTIRTVLNAILPESLQLPEMNFKDKIATATKPPSFDTTQDTMFQSYQAEAGDKSLGRVKNTLNPFDGDAIKFTGSAKDNPAIQTMVTSRLQEMYRWFNSTNGRVQWTNLGEGFVLGGGIDSFENATIEDIMSSTPIVDGYDRTIDDLSNPNLLATPFDNAPDSPFKTDFFKNLTTSSDARQNTLAFPDGSLESRIAQRLGLDGDFDYIGSNAGAQLVKLEAARRAIIADATKFAQTQTLIQAGNNDTNIQSKSEFNMQNNVINTDQNMTHYYLGDRTI